MPIIQSHIHVHICPEKMLVFQFTELRLVTINHIYSETDEWKLEVDVLNVGNRQKCFMIIIINIIVIAGFTYLALERRKLNQTERNNLNH